MQIRYVLVESIKDHPAITIDQRVLIINKCGLNIDIDEASHKNCFGKRVMADVETQFESI